MANKPVKPAKDKDESVMIPLQKLSNKSQDSSTGHTSFTVEMVYFRELPSKMEHSGDLEFALPSLDLPVTQYFVSLYLPER